MASGDLVLPSPVNLRGSGFGVQAGAPHAGKSAHDGPDWREWGPGGNNSVNNFCTPHTQSFSKLFSFPTSLLFPTVLGV